MFQKYDPLYVINQKKNQKTGDVTMFPTESWVFVQVLVNIRDKNFEEKKKYKKK